MRNHTRLYTVFLLAIVALSLQSCLGFGGNDQFQNTNTGKNGGQIGINKTDQAVFKGKIYFTLNRNLYMLDGNRNLTQLTHDIDVRDPAVSPDGKWIAFITRHTDYSDLAYMPSTGGEVKILRTGNGRYVNNPGFPPMSTHHWYAQPAWAPDSEHLLFLSDIDKATFDIGIDTFLLDLQAFSISIKTPERFQRVAYATYGDGGLRDPSYRPGHPDQVIYTNYKYDHTQTHQVIQLFMEDPDAIARHPGRYRPGVEGLEVDPAVALTPDTPDLANLQPAFSPDGNTIMYVRREDATHMSIYTMPVPEGITGDPNNPAFDPNTPANQKNALAPYAKSSKLLTKQYLCQPIWSPDGKQIAYLDYSNNVFDIWLATLNKDPKTGIYSIKGNAIQLTNTNDQLRLDGDSHPVWVP